MLKISWIHVPWRSNLCCGIASHASSRCRVEKPPQPRQLSATLFPQASPDLKRFLYFLPPCSIFARRYRRAYLIHIYAPDINRPHPTEFDRLFSSFYPDVARQGDTAQQSLMSVTTAFLYKFPIKYWIGKLHCFSAIVLSSKPPSNPIHAFLVIGFILDISARPKTTHTDQS